MPLRYYEGIEGSGKTCMMTRDLYLHAACGGKVFSFPGYELKDKKGNLISETLLPEQWVTFPDDLKRRHIAIAIDEVTNFFNNHVWYNKMCDMMAGLMSQRRKFEIAILMTGPVFDRLPPVIREMVHEVIHCTDNHTINHMFKRGEQCKYYKQDLRGMLSTPQHHYTRKKIFHTKPWWPYYDTYQAVDLINQFIKVRFKARTIIVGADGNIINQDQPILQSDSKWDWLSDIISNLKKKGLRTIEPWQLNSMIGRPITAAIKGRLSVQGIHWGNSEHCYVIE